MLITAWLWQHERESQQTNLRASFDFELRQTTTRIQSRITSYEQMLRGVGGLFAAAGRVTQEDFSLYVDSLSAGPDFAGLRSLGYAALQRAAPDNQPLKGDREPMSAPLTYVAPVAGPIIGTLGQDVLTQPQRRAAMLQARDSGRFTVSQRLAAGSTSEPEWGFLMCLPIFEKDRPIDTVERRRAYLVGWVFASFRVIDLMASLYGESAPGLEAGVFDGVTVGEDTRLYPPNASVPGPSAALFEAQEYVGLAGHAWTLLVRSTPEFEQRFSNDSARIIAVAGGGLSLVLALLTWQILTGRQRAHASAHAMTRQLRESSAQYRRIVDTADEGIWMVDAGGRTSFVNPKMQQMIGYDAAELDGRCWTDFMDESGRQMLGASGVDGLASRRSEPLEIGFRRKDSTQLPGSLSTSPIADDSGQIVGFLAMVTDVTRHMRAEADRTHLERQLRQSQKMEAIGTLAGGVAHDFNNILASILGNAALIQQDLGAEHPASARLEQVRLAGERGRSLVHQIGAFSRREPQQRLSQPLRPLLEEAATLLRSTLPAQVVIDLRLSSAPLNISADATQLQQVLINLCTNAWHAMPGGKGHIAIALNPVLLDRGGGRTAGHGLAAGWYAHLQVADDGCGMDEAVRLRIFEPFYTTKAIGKGTGLGLSVVHGIVASHGGAIGVESSPGKGSTFDMYFPLAIATADTIGDGDAPVASGLAEVRGGGQHVLYVDDDQVMVIMVEALLHRAGYRVTSLSDPRRALVLACGTDDAVDLVVTDFNMPDHVGHRSGACIEPPPPRVARCHHLGQYHRRAAQRRSAGRRAPSAAEGVHAGAADRTGARYLGE